MQSSPLPESLGGRRLNTLKKMCPLTKAMGDLTWWCELLLVRSGDSRKAIRNEILAVGPTPSALARGVNDALLHLQERGVAPKPGAASAISELIGMARLAVGKRPPALSGLFLELPFKLQDLRVLLAALVDFDGPTLSDPVANQAWMLADKDLAGALQRAGQLRAVARSNGKLDGSQLAAIGDVAMLVSAAARHRGMELEGCPGEVVDMNPSVHSEDDPRVKTSAKVRVGLPAVRQGLGASSRVILKADVEPVAG